MFPGLIGVQNGTIAVPAGFKCTSRQCCPAESALLCVAMATERCAAFALNQAHWFHGLVPQLYSIGHPSPQHPHEGWTFYGSSP